MSYWFSMLLILLLYWTWSSFCLAVFKHMWYWISQYQQELYYRLRVVKVTFTLLALHKALDPAFPREFLKRYSLMRPKYDDNDGSLVYLLWKSIFFTLLWSVEAKAILPSSPIQFEHKSNSSNIPLFVLQAMCQSYHVPIVKFIEFQNQTRQGTIGISQGRWFRNGFYHVPSVNCSNLVVSIATMWEKGSPAAAALY